MGYGDHSDLHDHGPAGYWDGREDEQREYERFREPRQEYREPRRRELAAVGAVGPPRPDDRPEWVKAARTVMGGADYGGTPAHHFERRYGEPIPAHIGEYRRAVGRDGILLYVLYPKGRIICYDDVSARLMETDPALCPSLAAPPPEDAHD